MENGLKQCPMDTNFGHSKFILSLRRKKQGMIFENTHIKELKFPYYLDKKEIKPFDAVIASQRSQNDEESFPFDLCEW